MLRTLLLGTLFGSTLACNDIDDPVAEGTWEVVVTGVSTSCTQDNSGYEDTFDYQLFTDGADIELRIGELDGGSEGFAMGVRSGCALQYQTAVWLEERDQGDLRWQITGEASYQGAGGGCDLTDGLDWEGTEIITVVESLDEDVVEDCTYMMMTEGVLVQ
jgi:hypothetical protein